MKKYYVLLIIFLLPVIVLASPNATIKTSKDNIKKGETVTVTVTLTDTAAWNINIVGSGASSCSKREADVTSDASSTTKKISLSCKATSEGTINIKVTGDITSESAETKEISLKKDVVVKGTSETDTPKPPVDDKQDPPKEDDQTPPKEDDPTPPKDDDDRIPKDVIVDPSGDKENNNTIVFILLGIIIVLIIVIVIMIINKKKNNNNINYNNYY